MRRGAAKRRRRRNKHGVSSAPFALFCGWMDSGFAAWGHSTGPGPSGQGLHRSDSSCPSFPSVNSPNANRPRRGQLQRMLGRLSSVVWLGGLCVRALCALCNHPDGTILRASYTEITEDEREITEGSDAERRGVGPIGRLRVFESRHLHRDPKEGAAKRRRRRKKHGVSSAPFALFCGWWDSGSAAWGCERRREHRRFLADKKSTRSRSAAGGEVRHRRLGLFRLDFLRAGDLSCGRTYPRLQRSWRGGAADPGWPR